MLVSNLLSCIVLVINLFTTQTAIGFGQQKTPSYSTPEEKQGVLIRSLRSYEIDFPTITDGEKAHLGYLTDGSSRRRRRRAINVADDNDRFHYKFRANGQDYHLKLRINKHLVGPDFKVEHYYGNGTLESSEMEEHCYLIGKTIPHKFEAAVSDCDGLSGVVNTEEDMLYIEPLLNISYVDEALLNGTGRPHLVYRHSQLPNYAMGFDGLGITRIEPANSRASRRRAPRRRNIQFSFLKFINRSKRIVKLMWVDRRRKPTFFATLMPGTSRLVNTFTSHKWMALDEDTNKQFLVGNKREYTPRKNKESRRTNVLITLPRGIRLKPTSEKEIRAKVGKKYVESMAVADKSVVEFHGKQRVSRYVLALMNVVSFIFKHKSLGFSIDYVVVRIVLLHKDPEIVTLEKDNPAKSLMSTCQFMLNIRIGRSDADPKFHDHATFLTRKVFGTAAGYAPVRGMCHPTKSCTLNQEDGFPSAFIIAHESGHSLGMEHDGEKNRCSSVTSHGSIMAPLVQSRLNRFMWSSCSRKELMGSIRNFPCLNDKPGKKHEDDLPYLHRYPGVHYSVDDQCLFDFGKGYSFCRAFHRNPCQILWCNMPPPHNHLCKSMRAPALNGTECATGKWCVAGRCVRRTEKIIKPKAIDGNWTDWQNWEACSQECGLGVRIRRRTCDSPAPRHGGKDCVGSSMEEDVCKIKDCEHTIPLYKNNLRNQCVEIGRKRDKYRPWSYYDESSVNLNCTFEHNFCAWINLKRDDERDWTLNRGRTRTSKTGPSVDHTTNSTRGQYIYFESSSPVRNKDKAAIASPDMAVRRACLSFYYHMFGHRMGSLKVVRINAKGRRILWAKHTNQGDRWLNAKIDIEESSVYNLVIEAHRKDSYLGDIALDDITFTVGSCDDKNTNNTEANGACEVSCIRGGSNKRIYMNNILKNGIRCSDDSALDICINGVCRKVGCDNVLDSGKKFDRCGVCDGNGTSCKLNAGNIKLTQNEDMEVVLNVPKGSSSLNVKKRSNSNNLLVLSVGDPDEPDDIEHIINGDVQESPPAIYYGGGTQYVYTNEHGEEVIKSLGVVKKPVFLNIKAKERTRYSPIEVTYEYFDLLDIKAGREIPGVSAVTLENTEMRTRPTVSVEALTPEATPEPTPAVQEEQPRWVITDNWTPCSRSCGKGVTFLKYFCKIGDQIQPRLLCKDLTLDVKERFRYCNIHPCENAYQWLPGPWSTCSQTCSLGIMTRQVTCVELAGKKQVAPARCGGWKPSETKACILEVCEPKWSTGNWTECTATCGLGSQTREVICVDQRGQRISGCNRTTEPESRRNCRKPACASPPADPLDCNFEKGLCEWTQMTNDNFDWQRNQGRTKSTETGPNHDHTLKNRAGHYMFIEASNPQRQDHRARLISPEVNARQACLTFYYHMWGSDTGKLRVKFLTESGYMNQYAWSKIGDQGRKWTRAEVNIPIGLSYQIVIEAIRGRGWRGDIAIDDIVFHHVGCREMRNLKVHIHSGKQARRANTAGNSE
ncbi:A disintegrin and metalloproteinase with thrombospondin motifs 3-like isoform X2 [Dendronephthya gigantea]|uniref:A disintegrin and metalloproteinase with thrombospondin motifs 3-like isoform X2 n=1 Tax=Dendronephthya gigantea TaxID=151771 RepID=UPI00106C9CE4|nr:A disintegrin and metalloproteinase with thrombospondin motifs 3-like isoform X2 [Dendronephthya gigantea]